MDSSIDRKPSATELPIGTRFAGHFQITRRLRADLAGGIYAVEDTQAAGEADRRRVLRVLLPSLTLNDSVLTALREQAERHTQLASPYILRLLDAGFDESTGLPFLVSQWCEGTSLESVLRQRDFVPFAELTLLIGQVCEGLGAAHAQGIWHGALKPANIFLCPAETALGPLQLKLADLGLMPIVALAQEDGAAIGTPQWMAPEQTSSGRPYGVPADIWALGLLVFRMLTGSSYWRAAQVRPLRIMSILREVMLEPLVPASVRAREYGCETRLPAGFDRWFGRCVHRAPEERFLDAHQAFAALRELACRDSPDPAGETTEAPTPEQKCPPIPAVGVADPRARRPAARRTWLWSCGFAMSALAFGAGYLVAGRHLGAAVHFVPPISSARSSHSPPVAAAPQAPPSPPPKVPALPAAPPSPPPLAPPVYGSGRAEGTKRRVTAPSLPLAPSPPLRRFPAPSSPLRLPPSRFVDPPRRLRLPPPPVSNPDIKEV